MHLVAVVQQRSSVAAEGEEVIESKSGNLLVRKLSPVGGSLYWCGSCGSTGQAREPTQGGEVRGYRESKDCFGSGGMKTE